MTELFSDLDTIEKAEESGFLVIGDIYTFSNSPQVNPLTKYKYVGDGKFERVAIQ